MQNPELPWIKIARHYLGLREIPGARHHPKIVQWWKDVKASWFVDDETPWCGAYVGGVLVEAGFQPAKDAPRALAWNNYGVKLDKPAYGCIVVFSRNGGGHVGFCVGRDQKGNLMILGGNQDNEVNIKPFASSRIVGYRWPSIWPADQRFNLPLLTSDGRLSTNEA